MKIIYIFLYELIIAHHINNQVLVVIHTKDTHHHNKILIKDIHHQVQEVIHHQEQEAIHHQEQEVIHHQEQEAIHHQEQEDIHHQEQEEIGRASCRERV